MTTALNPWAVIPVLSRYYAVSTSVLVAVSRRRVTLPRQTSPGQFMIVLQTADVGRDLGCPGLVSPLVRPLSASTVV